MIEKLKRLLKVRTGSKAPLQLVDCDSIAEEISSKIKAKIPMSLIRLGDGEGALLFWKKGMQNPHYQAHLQRHLGSHINEGDILQLQNLVVRAIDNVDILGVRDDIINVEFQQDLYDHDPDTFLAGFKKVFPLRNVEKGLNYHSAFRLAGLHDFVATHKFSKNTIFTTAWIHFELSAAHHLVSFMEGQKRIGLISSKPQLASAIESIFNIPVDFYHPPNDSPFVEGGPIHFPDQFSKILKSLKVEERGQLFLVGAGLCGKVYCDQIKSLGGIGLDIGAVCDAWINEASRPLVYKHHYDNQGNTVPDVLLLKNQTKSCS